MKIAILFLALVAIAVAVPLRPVISETYTATIFYNFQNNTHYFGGEGISFFFLAFWVVFYYTNKITR